jgi:hypothetical protein
MATSLRRTLVLNTNEHQAPISAERSPYSVLQLRSSALHFRRPPFGYQHPFSIATPGSTCPVASGGIADHLRPGKNCRSQRTWLHKLSSSDKWHSFAASIKIPTRHTARLIPPKDRGGLCGVAVSFFVMVFTANALALLYFFQIVPLLIKKVFVKK